MRWIWSSRENFDEIHLCGFSLRRNTAGCAEHQWKRGAKKTIRNPFTVYRAYWRIPPKCISPSSLYREKALCSFTPLEATVSNFRNSGKLLCAHVAATAFNAIVSFSRFCVYLYIIYLYTSYTYNFARLSVAARGVTVEEERDGSRGGRASDFAAFVQPSVRRLISEVIQYNAVADVNSVAESRFGVLLMSGLSEKTNSNAISIKNYEQILRDVTHLQQPWLKQSRNSRRFAVKLLKTTSETWPRGFEGFNIPLRVPSE
ncbi:Uncharacterized protein FWK35_00027394 [Aphis craccivora]|uniref:Uncharacterized protein n=1 Tax=Aphis craccivora TaxID=307492 RepID=A0A6G0ZGG5_APHCR|nr:Uncharacterized protein FWK35_00027394 [Aphis craccivora]